MKRTIHHSPAALLSGITSTLLLSALAASAGDVTWTGDPGNDTPPLWSNASNWSPAAPVAGDNLIFKDYNQLLNTNDLTGLTVGWLRFDNGDFILGGNALTLNGGLTNSGGMNSLALPLTLGAAQSFESAAGGNLSVSNTLNIGANTLTIAGDGDVSLAGVVSGTSALVKNGAGALMFAGINTYSGGLTVNAGMVNARTANAAGSGGVGSGNLTVNNGGTVTMVGDNAVFGQGATLAPPRIATINTGGVLTTGDRSGHAVALVLNGGTLSASTARGDYGNWNLDYGVSTLTNGSTSSIEGGNVTLGQTGGTVFNIGAGDTVNVSSIIARTTYATDLGLIKSGAGKLVLSEANTYTSATTINGGTLALTGSGSIDRSPTITLATNSTLDISGVYTSLGTNQTLAGSGRVIGTLNDNDPGAVGSAISPGGSLAAGTLTMDGLSLSGNSVVLNYNLSSVNTVGGGVNDLITVTNLTLAIGATNTVNLTVSGTPAAGAYTLIQYPLGQGPAAGPITTLAAATSRSTYTFTSDGTSIKVTIIPNPAPLVWRGDGTTNNWDLNASTNWMNGAAKDVFLTGDNATFNDTGSNTPSLNLVGAIPANIVTVAGSKDYTFAGSGRISGSSKLNKTSSGTLTILTPNDNLGGGSLSGGVVNVGNGVATGNLGSGNLTNNTKVNFNQSTSSTYAGNMSGTGSVNAFIPGATLSFTGTNTFTGGLLIQNGTVQIGNSPTVAGASIAGVITNYAGLIYSRTDAFTNQNTVTSAGNTFRFGQGDVSVRGAGGMVVDGTAPIDILGSLSVGQSLYGKLTFNPGASVTALGSLLLGNPNNAAYNGDVIQNGGTVTVSNQVRVGHWASEISTYTMNGGTLNIPSAQLAVGWDGIGLMTMNGGTVNARTLNIDDNGATGAIGGTNSTFTMTGGQLNIGSGGIGGNTATIRLGGGTITAVAPAGFTSGMAMVLTNGSPTFDSSSSAITLSGVLSGNGGLTKTGNGVLNLNGANTFTNAVTVTAGTLQGSGTILGPVTAQPGGTVSAGGTFATGTLTMSNLTASTGAGLIFDVSSTAATSDLLAVKGVLTLEAATPATFNFLGGTPYTGGPYTIITNWNVRSGSLTYANSTRFTPTFDFSNPNRVQVTFAGTNAGLVWRGDVNNLWNVNTTANWLNAGGPDKYFQSDSVVFNNTGIATPNVTLSSAMTPASVAVNAAGDYKFSGAPLTGFTTLTKSGTGKLTLENDYTSTGVITVNGGTLQIGNGGTTGSITGLGNVAGATIADYSSVVFNRSDTVIYNGVINGPGTLTQAGSGKLLITGANTFLGGTTINPGCTVQVGNGALADAGVLGNGIVTNKGAVIFYRAGNIAVATPYTGNGSLTFLGTGASGQSGYSLNATNTFTGLVTLSLARIQSGAGALSFGAPSSINVLPGSQVYAVATPYSSTYNIPLTLTGTGWQDGLGALRIENGGTWAGPITLANNARIAVNNATTNIITGTISGGSYELETYGGNAATALVLAPSTPNTFGALRISIGAAGAVTLAGNANAIPNNIPLFMNGGVLKLNGSDKSFSSFINLNANSSIQNGSSNSAVLATLTTPLNASFTWGTFNDGGPKPLNVTLNQSGLAGVITMGADSGSWTGNFTNTGGAITISGGTSRLGNFTVPSRIVVLNNSILNVSINNGISGGSATEPTMILNNTVLNVTRYNGFGPLVLNASTLQGNITSDAGYGQYALFGGKVTVVGSAPSLMAGTGTSTSPGYQLATPTLFDVANVASGVDLTVSAPLRVGGSGLGGTGALIKTGAGTMLVDAVATYTGSTVVSNGVLTIGASGSIASSTLIKVNSGATLDATAPGGLTLATNILTGSGTVLGTVIDGAASIIAPGASIGTLTVGGMTFNGTGGTVAIELNSTNTAVGGTVNDLLQINGNLSLNDSAPTPVNFIFPNGANAAGTYTIMKYTGSLSGTAAGLTNTQGFAVTFTVGGGLVRATFTAAPAQSLVWQGDGSLNVWDVTTTSVNWSNTATTTLTNFYPLDAVRFDDSSVNTTVDVAASVNPASVTFDSVNPYTLLGAGKISGTTGITKKNTGTLTLSTANDFSGPVNVNAGVLAQGNAAAMPLGAAVNVAANAQFDFAGMGNDNTRGYSFTIAGNGPDGSGALVNSGGAIYSYANVSNLTLTADAVVGGVNRWDVGLVANSKLEGQGFNLTKAGSFDLGMRFQTITNLASITVSNGNMWYENFDQTNAWTATTTNYVKPGAFLGNYGSRTINLPIALEDATLRAEGANGVPTWTGPIKVTGTNRFNNATVQNLYGVISGSGTIGIDGGRSAQVITNANTYSGGTIVSNAPSTASNASGASGTAAIVAAHANALGTGPLTIDGSSFSSLLTNTAFFGTNVLRPVEFNVTGGGIVPNAINLPGVGPITNVALQGRDSSSIFTLAGKISGGFAGLTNWVDFGNAGSLGVMRLSNPANDFIATLNVNRGNLAITADGCLGNAANLVRLNQNAAFNGIRFDAPGINIAHRITAAATSYLNLFGDNNGDGIQDTVNTATISGVISGGSRIRPMGTNGTLILTGNNTHAGTETWEPTIVQFAAVTNLGAGFISPNMGGTFRYTGTGSETFPYQLWIDNSAPGGTIEIQSPTAVLTLSVGGGTINYPFFKTGPGTLTLASQGVSGGILTVNGGTMSMGGVISGGTTQVKVNSGTLVLTAANTYGGPTLVNGGSLFVHGSLPAGNAVTVAPTALLGGNGTINGPVTVSGALQPGNNNIGKLTINSLVTLMGTTTMEIDKAAGTNDAVVGAATLSYGGTLTVNNLGGTLAAGDTFKLFGAWAYMGSFTSTNLPALSAGLAWDTSGLVVDGTIKVVSSGPPAVSGATLLPNGNVQITLSGTVGQGYKILGSTNVLLPVASWSVLNSGTLPTATYNWEDTDTKNHPIRFYIISTP